MIAYMKQEKKNVLYLQLNAVIINQMNTECAFIKLFLHYTQIR